MKRKSDNVSPFPKLTPKQHAYALARIGGKNQADSLRQAIPNNRLSPGALRVEAVRLEAHPKVAAYIAAAQKEARSEVILTRDKKRQILGSIALDASAPDHSRIAAVKEDNAMTGDSKIRFEGEVTLHSIFLALPPSTGLLNADEIEELQNVTPAAKKLPAPKPAEAPPLVEVPAMERATG